MFRLLLLAGLLLSSISLNGQALSYASNNSDLFSVLDFPSENMLSRVQKMRLYMLGRPAPGISRATIDGDKFKLRHLAGKTVVLSFWEADCHNCWRTIPALNQLMAEHQGDENVVFLAIFRDDILFLDQLLEYFPFDFPHISMGATLAGKYRVINYPTHIIVGPDGRIMEYLSGTSASIIRRLDEVVDYCQRAINAIERHQSQDGR